MTHTDELTLIRMIDAELSAGREQAAREHLLACVRCRSTYEVLKAESETIRAALREEEEPLPDAVRPGSELSWLSAAALALSVLGATSFWNRVVEPALERMDSVGLDGASLFSTILIRSVLWRGWTDMASTMFQAAVAFAVVLTAAGLLVWALRKRRSREAMVCLAVLAAFGPSAPDASAAVIELERESYVLREGETIDNDLVVAGERVRIEGVVTGDLVVLARIVEIPGEVRGDVLGFAEEIDVSGTVGGSLRTGSRSLTVQGSVARNVSSAGETLRLRAEGQVGGSFTGAGREVFLSGSVRRDLLAAAQYQELNGLLGGSALLAGERLSVGPEANVEGEIDFYGAEEPDVSPEARLASPITFERLEEEEDDTVSSFISSFVYFWAAAFVLGAAVMLVGPRATETIRAVHLPDTGKSLLVGTLSILVTVVLGVVFCVTLIGLPLGLVTLFLWGFGIYVAQAFVGLYLGSRILGEPRDTASTLGRLALGLFLIHLGKAIPILGTLVTLAVAIWGFGALTLWALDRAPWTSARPPVPAEARP